MLKDANYRMFHAGEHLVTVVHARGATSLLRAGRLPLAQLSTEPPHASLLLASDEKASVLNALQNRHGQPITYDVYGYALSLSESLLRFDGEFQDAITHLIYMGNGKRCRDPRMSRFLQPDELSPFGKGGVNTYGYVSGDPVNRIDPSGQFSWLIKAFRRVQKFFGKGKNSPPQHENFEMVIVNDRQRSPQPGPSRLASQTVMTQMSNDSRTAGTTTSTLISAPDAGSRKFLRYETSREGTYVVYRTGGGILVRAHYPTHEITVQPDGYTLPDGFTIPYNRSRVVSNPSSARDRVRCSQ